jgi:cytochrome c-type biogenesis protein CcmH
MRLKGLPPLVFSALCLAASPAPARAADLTPLEQVEEGLLCHCGCAGLTVRTCTCGTADGMRGEIASRLASGQTPSQVIESFVATYGEQIRPAPTKSGFNLVAWVTPFAALLIAGSCIVVLVRRWGLRRTRPAGDGQAGTEPDAPAASSPGAPRLSTDAERAVLRRVEREMKENF